ncbi:MAG: M23 family metallopeptidase [Clostridia bacterium]|nr:M23 family metallopeptidase [Clostridia bacterium]
MNKSNNVQKKKYASSYIYAVIVAVLVIACAVTIALVNKGPSKSNVANIGGENIPVAAKPSYVLPMNGAQVMKDYSGKELQYNDTLKQWEIHKAIDFQAGEDKNVYAISNGTISNIYTNYLEGTVIEISHGNGLLSVYKSLDKEVQVSIGDSVSAGQVIGVVAESMAQELNSGNHLHFEMLQDGKKIDPNNYLSLGEK